MTRSIILLLLFVAIGCNTITESNHGILGKEHAKQQLKEALEGSEPLFDLDTLIKGSATAISVAEAVLFEHYGKEKILEEKPYETYLIDGYWFVSGTIPKGADGGAFEIILNAKNGEIIRLTHYK